MRMSPTLLTIIVIILIAILMVIQSLLSKLEKPVFGAIIPFIILAVAIYSHFIATVEPTWVSVMVFVVPFVWSLEEWYKGRRKRIVEQEKEIQIMKAKDIE